MGGFGRFGTPPPLVRQCATTQGSPITLLLLLTFTQGSRIFDSLSRLTCVVFPHLSTPSRRMKTPLVVVIVCDVRERMAAARRKLRVLTRVSETSARFEADWSYYSVRRGGMSYD